MDTERSPTSTARTSGIRSPSKGWEQEAPVMIERGEGSLLFDTDGNAYLDGVRAVVTVHGHGHPAIDAAVRGQLDRVAHSTMLGLSHRARRARRRLVEIAPPGLSGSSTPTTAPPPSRSR